jgi:hypothetical protein
MITPTPFQQTVLDSPARLKLVRGAPRIGKTMLAALVAFDQAMLGHEVLYLSPFRPAMEHFARYALTMAEIEGWRLQVANNRITIGEFIVADFLSEPRRQRGYRPDLLILDQVDQTPIHAWEGYMAERQALAKSTLLIYDPRPEPQPVDAPLDGCEWVYLRSLLGKDYTDWAIFDASPLLPGGYINPCAPERSNFLIPSALRRPFSYREQVLGEFPARWMQDSYKEDDHAD